jgi:WD40 repeat-containing protein SMU1
MDSFAVLEKEANVALNTVENLKTLQSHVRHGRWDHVLDIIPASLPSPLAFDLYEHIVIELVEMGDIDTARALLKTAPPMMNLKQTDKNRYKLDFFTFIH